MHVEVDDRHAFRPVHRLRVPGRDRHVVEEAEAHRGRALGMVAGRAGAHEGIGGPPRHDGVDRQNRSARRARHRLPRPWRQEGVGVEPHEALARRRVLQALQVGFGMDPCRRGPLDTGRLLSREAGEPIVRERPFKRPQAVRTLGVARPHVVAEAGGMGDVESGHGGPRRATGHPVTHGCWASGAVVQSWAGAACSPVCHLNSTVPGNLAAAVVVKLRFMILQIMPLDEMGWGC